MSQENRATRLYGSAGSDRSVRSEKPAQWRRLRPSGGYRTLRSFQVATLVYDGTVSFCERFLDSRSRTVDQMVQAARSGRQNISEGSRASAASSQTELRLVTVARASLEELLLDYEDYLRQHGLRQWTAADPEAREVRKAGMGAEHEDPMVHWKLYARWLEHSDPAVVANTMLCLIHQANYLLDRQITALEQEFVQGGGYSERLGAARVAERERQRTKPGAPSCPRCGKPLVLRTARKGNRAGSQFWGCSAYPACEGNLPLDSARENSRSNRSAGSDRSA